MSAFANKSSTNHCLLYRRTSKQLTGAKEARLQCSGLPQRSVPCCQPACSPAAHSVTSQCSQTCRLWLWWMGAQLWPGSQAGCIASHAAHDLVHLVSSSLPPKNQCPANRKQQSMSVQIVAVVVCSSDLSLLPPYPRQPHLTVQGPAPCPVPPCLSPHHMPSLPHTTPAADLGILVGRG